MSIKLKLARSRLQARTSGESSATSTSHLADNTDLPEGQQIPADTPQEAAEYFRGFKTPGGLTVKELEARKRTIVLLPTTFKESEEICNCCLNGYKPGQSIIFAKCGHKYHLNCFYDFVKNWRACALCRKDMATGKNL
ncbi:unnamed protein product [Meloidogyne enterolobii]|uniref:Uncharacterized protein n=1 Tax=Meloidogyne enterolobii TaxID=390850 RepID=A0ACB0Y5Q9_MELEN